MTNANAFVKVSITKAFAFVNNKLKEGEKLKINVNHVKALIAERGQNVKDFSEETGISYGTLGSLFCKSRSGNLKTVGRIAKGLGVSVAEIIIED